MNLVSLIYSLIISFVFGCLGVSRGGGSAVGGDPERLPKTVSTTFLPNRDPLFERPGGEASDLHFTHFFTNAASLPWRIMSNVKIGPPLSPRSPFCILDLVSFCHCRVER